jgi:hypothetical protein
MTKLILLLAIAGGLTQAPAEKDPFAPLRALEGDWHGDISGKLGTGTGVRHYELILDGKYLLSRHASVRVPQEKSPEGDHHRELAVWSYDSARETLVLREFMVEGFILQSVCNVAGNTIQCEAEEVESGPGWQARLELEIKSPYELIERFWLAEPGQELEQYFENRWTRIPKLD